MGEQRCASDRKRALDFLKYICAFLVICIHTDFPGKTMVDPVARIAVWGQKLSLEIYVYNKIVRVVIYKCLDLLPDAMGVLVTALKWASPVVVLVGTSVLVSCMNRLYGLVTAKYRRRE